MPSRSSAAAAPEEVGLAGGKSGSVDLDSLTRSEREDARLLEAYRDRVAVDGCCCCGGGEGRDGSVVGRLA
jgi:hypothetical protein